MSKKAKVYRKELEIADPLVQRLAEIGGTDFEYVEILQHLEIGQIGSSYLNLVSLGGFETFFLAWVPWS